jgi:hypothetical protein
MLTVMVHGIRTWQHLHTTRHEDVTDSLLLLYVPFYVYISTTNKLLLLSTI